MAAGVLVNLLIKIFILTIFGYFLKKWKIITQELQEGLNNLLLKAILPVSVLMSSQNDYSIDAVNDMLITAVVALAYYMIALIVTTLVSKRLSLSNSGKKVFITMSVFANVAFIGYPIMQELYGNEGVLLAVVYNIFFQLIFFTYGISLLSGKKQMKLKMLYTNPVVLASFACVVLFIFQIKVPTGISSALSSIGGMTVPVSMMLIGCSLAEVKVKEIMKDFYSYLVSAFRMILFPLAMTLVFYFIKVPAIVAGSCIVLTALPAGSLNVIYAQQYNCEAGYASKTVVQTMVIMIVTVPLMIILVNLLL